MKYIFAALSLSVLLFAVGCSGKVPLGGKVTFSDDGSPVTKGAVCFMSDTVLAQGGIKPDGTFQLGTDKATDGLPLGIYKVSIVGTEEVSYVEIPAVGTSPPGRREIHKDLIDKKFSDPETSGLTFTVDGKQRVFNIEVDRAAK